MSESPLKKLKRLVGESKAIRNGALSSALGKKMKQTVKHGYSINEKGEEKELSEKEQESMRQKHGDTRVE